VLGIAASRSAPLILGFDYTTQVAARRGPGNAEAWVQVETGGAGGYKRRVVDHGLGLPADDYLLGGELFTGRLRPAPSV
jgi:hypothetical protein